MSITYISRGDKYDQHKQAMDAIRSSFLKGFDRFDNVETKPGSVLGDKLSTPDETKTASVQPEEYTPITGIVRIPEGTMDRRKSAAELLEKEAAVIGGPNSSELEVGLAQVAESHINNKAPLLKKFMLGFQLLKKTDDDTKACGIFAYKLGTELVYIPVFVINGAVQGHEMMYVVSKDQFVPSDEKWVNFLLSRKPLEPGQTETRERSEIHAQGTYRPTYFSSGMKLSSVDIPALPWPIVQDALRTVFKKASVGTPGLERTFWGPIREGAEHIPTVSFKQAAFVPISVTDLFRKSAKSVKLAAAWSRDYPVFGRLLDYAMGGEDLGVYEREWEKRAAFAKSIGVKATPFKPSTLGEKLAAIMPKKEAPKAEDPGRVAVYGLDKIASHQFRFMDPEIVSEIHRNGYYVADTRDQTKLAAVIDDSLNYSNSGQIGLCNPVGPGAYKVFMSNGSFRDCVIFERCQPNRRVSREGKEYLVLDIESKVCAACSPGQIWVAGPSDDPKWMEKIPESNAEINKVRDDESTWMRHKGVMSLLITPCGRAWKGEFVKMDDGTYLEEGDESPVSLSSESLKGFKLLGSHVYDDSGSFCSSIRCGFPIIGPKGTILRRYKKDECRPVGILRLGNRQLWLDMLMDHTVPINIRRGRRAFKEYAIDDEPAKVKSASLESLMIKHHLSQGTAEWLLKEADMASPGPITYLRQKVAFSGPVPQDRLSVTFPQRDKHTEAVTGLPAQSDLDTEEIVEALRTNNEDDPRLFDPRMPDAESSQGWGTDTPPAPDPQAMNLATQAAQAGQKDFVSSQMLLSLLREIDNDDLIPEYVNIFEKSCDALGRLYMQLLWRTDAFEERFGSTQMREFKEMLVSLFQQTGDFICYLRQRDIRPAPVLSLGSIALDSEGGK